MNAFILVLFLNSGIQTIHGYADEAGCNISREAIRTASQILYATHEPGYVRAAYCLPVTGAK